MGAGLGSMVAKLTLGVRKFEQVDAKMRELIPPLHQAAHALIPMIDADTNAFNDYITALGLPKDTEADRAYRADQLQLGLKKAIDTPLSVMKAADGAWDALAQVAKYGNIASKSDVEVGARALEMGIWGAYKNVRINMTDITDDAYKKETLALAESFKDRAQAMSRQVLEILDSRS
jgi:glutamate formiminotransferase / formiminotetrahydrofolate cyclodeaminase